MEKKSLPKAPDKTLVLTFDDSVRSHLERAAPLLKKLRFAATFFVTHRWLPDKENFLQWEEMATLHDMGFEIGCHSWTHRNFGAPKMAARLAGELSLVARELAAVGVPAPASFSWPANYFGPESLQVLRDHGFTFARRGLQPEVDAKVEEACGRRILGPVYDPVRHHPLLVPSAGNGCEHWTMDFFHTVAASARDGKIPVVQFHGVPDPVHPWVTTRFEQFEQFMLYLKQQNFRVLAMRDLKAFADCAKPPQDPLVNSRYPAAAVADLHEETLATRQDSLRWLPVMRRFKYSKSEIATCFAMDLPPKAAAKRPRPARGKNLAVLPFPGGRHPRRGARNIAISPLRGSKAGIFAPWARNEHVVLDLPEAIFAGSSLLFLAHYHLPTIWDRRNELLENRDWQDLPQGGLTNHWDLPNGVAFGAEIVPCNGQECLLRLWLRNGSVEPLTGMRVQVCAMLGGLQGFLREEQERTMYLEGLALAGSADGRHGVALGFRPHQRTWGNAPCPCIHADPSLADAAPGATVTASGFLRFFQNLTLAEAAGQLAHRYQELVSDPASSVQKRRSC